MKTRTILVAFVALVALFLAGEKAQAQAQPGYIYTYDKNGNRTSRTYSATVLFKQGAAAESKSAAGEVSLSIFPNPTDDALHFRFDLGLTAPTRVQIVNILGQTLVESEVPAGAQEWTMPTGGISAGTYYAIFNKKVQPFVKR